MSGMGILKMAKDNTWDAVVISDQPRIGSKACLADVALTCLLARPAVMGEGVASAIEMYTQRFTVPLFCCVVLVSSFLLQEFLH